jgi:hypothetical protein
VLRTLFLGLNEVDDRMEFNSTSARHILTRRNVGDFVNEL